MREGQRKHPWVTLPSGPCLSLHCSPPLWASVLWQEVLATVLSWCLHTPSSTIPFFRELFPQLSVFFTLGHGPMHFCSLIPSLDPTPVPQSSGWSHRLDTCSLERRAEHRELRPCWAWSDGTGCWSHRDLGSNPCSPLTGFLNLVILLTYLIFSLLMIMPY